MLPVNEKTQLIRTIKNEKSDWEALARCYNSFKDPESWPDGFGGNLLFTGDWVEERLATRDLTTLFVVTDTKNDQKIVGVCFCNPSWNLPNSYYVELLGVDPSYQKMNYGKNLLLKATEFAFIRKLQMIGLHTWGGNLKAMPLYKRVGFKWRPNTEVFMESYIPQILNYSLFHDIFSNFNWFNIYKPIITQEPNLEFEEEMGIYEYYFEMNEKESLKVWIDRTVGYISGFHIKNGKQDIIIKATTPKSEAYVGIEEFPVELQIVNQSSTQKTFSIRIKPTKSINLTSNPLSETIVLQPDEKKIIQVHGRFSVNTSELDMKVHSHTYCEHNITFEINYDKYMFPLIVGKVPRKAIDVKISPQNFSTVPNYEGTLLLNFTNIIGSDKLINFDLEDGVNIKFVNHHFNLNVNSYDSSIEIPFKIGNTDSSVDYFTINAFSNQETIIQGKKIPISIFKEDKAITYEYEDQIFIENKSMKVSLYKKPQPGQNELYIIDKNTKLKINGHPLILGYPFDNEGSEFYTKSLIHEIKTEKEGIYLFSSAISTQKRGILVTRKVFIPNENEPFFVTFSIENQADNAIDNLGIQFASYWWPGLLPILRNIQPLSQGIVQDSLPEMTMDMGKDPSTYSEGWKALEFAYGTIGILFDPSKFDKISIGQTYPVLDYKLPNVAAKQRYDAPKVWYCFTDNWQMVRKHWQDLFHPSPKNQFKSYTPVRDMKRIGFTTTVGKTISKGFLTDRTSQDVLIAIDSYKKTVFKGKCELRLETNDPIKFDLSGENTTLWKEKLNINSENNRFINGDIIFDSLSRIYKIPVSIGYYDSHKTTTVHTRSSNTREYIELDNGFLTLRGSADYRGQVYYISINNSKENCLLTHYPEVKPFLWFNKFFGGIGGVIREEDSWDLTKYNELKFKMIDLPEKGHWKGIAFESEIITYSPKLKGLQVKNIYLTLPDSPFILIRQEVTNFSGVERRFDAYIDTTLNPSNSTNDRYYTKSKNQVIEFRTHDTESLVGHHKDHDSRWAVYKKEGSNYYFGMILDKYTDYNDEIYLYIPNLTYSQMGCFNRGVKIQSGETLKFNVLVCFSKDLKTFEPFIENNIQDIFEEE